MTQVRRRTLFVIPTLTAGGAEQVIVTILRHLDRDRFLPMLAVVDTRNAVFTEDVPEDVELIDLHCSRVRYAMPKLLKLIRHRRPDAVLSTLGELNLALAVMRPLLPNDVRYLARETIILSAELESKPWSPVWRCAYRRFYRRLDTVICLSSEMQKDLIQHFAVPPKKTVVIHNPLDLERIRRLANVPLHIDYQREDPLRGGKPLHLVSAGRLTYQKGFDLLIDAIALSAPSVQLTILGDGPLRGQLEQRAAAKHVANRVRFVGFQKNPYPFMAQADAFVLSSRFEGFPNVVLEALACGTPVIAVPAPGGVEEILSGITGCGVSQATSAESLAQAIRCFSPGRLIDHRLLERYAVATITRLYEEELAVESA